MAKKKPAKKKVTKKAKRKVTKKKAAPKKAKLKATKKAAKKKASPKRAVKKDAKITVEPSGKLTAKQEQFCREYIVDFNATQAAIRAGYSKKTAQQAASRLLLNVVIQKKLTELIKERQKRTQTKADDAMNECCRIAFADVGQAFNEDNTLKAIHEMPEDIRRAVSGIEVDEIYSGTGEDRVLTGYTKKIKFWSKGRQIENLFKHHGLFSKDNAQQGKSLAQLISDAVHEDKGK